MGLAAKNKADLLAAITDNWRWVLSAACIIDIAFLEEHFTEEELTAADIYTKGRHIISNARAFACGSSTVTAYNSSTVTAYDSSYVEDRHGGLRPSGGRAIIKDYHGRKLYIQKGAFEIIDID